MKLTVPCDWKTVDLETEQNANWFGECIGEGDEGADTGIRQMSKTTTTMDFANEAHNIEFQVKLDNGSDTITIDSMSIIKY